jgi:putative phage-type endonuclease
MLGRLENTLSQDRRGFIGGSDVASIFGVSPWKSAYDLWEEKTATEFVPQEVDSKREKLYKRGKFLEPWVLSMLEEERGLFVLGRNQIYHDAEHPWMRAEIDFELQTDAGLSNGDVKTIHPFAALEWGEEDTDQIPLNYALQFMWGLMVTGRPLCVVAVLIGADDLRVYMVKRDDELIAEIRRRVVQFWTEHVVPKKAPTPQTVSDIHKVLFKFGGFPVAMDDALAEALKKIRDVKEAAKEIKKLQEQYELEIKRLLLVKAEAAGITDTPKKFVINDMTGKRTASLNLEHRSGYVVKETEFWVLRT